MDDDVYDADDNETTSPEVALQMAKWAAETELRGCPDTPDGTRHLIRFAERTIEGMGADVVLSACGLAEAACRANIQEAAEIWTALANYTGSLCVRASDPEDTTELAHEASERAVVWAVAWGLLLTISTGPVQLQPFPDA